MYKVIKIYFIVDVEDNVEPEANVHEVDEDEDEEEEN